MFKSSAIVSAGFHLCNIIKNSTSIYLHSNLFNYFGWLVISYIIVSQKIEYTYRGLFAVFVICFLYQVAIWYIL